MPRKMGKQVIRTFQVINTSNTLVAPDMPRLK
jgi:hypothetical protein